MRDGINVAIPSMHKTEISALSRVKIEPNWLIVLPVPTRPLRPMLGPIRPDIDQPCSATVCQESGRIADGSKRGADSRNRPQPDIRHGISGWPPTDFHALL